MKKIYIYIAAALVLLMSCVTSFATCKSQKDEIKRLSDNQEALIKEVQKIPVTDSTYAVDVARLNLSLDELKEYNTRVTSLCDQLNIKFKRVQSAVESASVTEVAVETVVHDTIIKYVDKAPVYGKTFSWNDNYVKVDGVLHEDSIKCNVKSNDTLTQVVYRVPRRWLCFNFGTKAIRQAIYSSNPHTNLMYSEYVEVQRE